MENMIETLKAHKAAHPYADMPIGELFAAVEMTLQQYHADLRTLQASGLIKLIDGGHAPYLTDRENSIVVDLSGGLEMVLDYVRLI